VLLNHWLPTDQVDAWGWRIPLLIGVSLVPMLFVLRRSLRETEEFSARQSHPSTAEIGRLLIQNAGVILTGVTLVLMTTVCFYLITAYTPTFGREVLHLDPTATMIVTTCVGASNLFWLPLSGALSDRVGRKPILVAMTVLAITSAYPVMVWLTTAPSFSRLLAAELWLSFIFGVYNGANVVYLTEIVPPRVRASGFSLAYSLATCVGGFTPVVCTWLIGLTHNKAIPGMWLSGVAVLALAAALVSRPFSDRHAN
jgi:MFS family permease